MPEENFAPDYVDEQEYEYGHRDGSSVKVSIDEMQNGGRVGVYHYSEDGKRLNYYRFRINQVETRTLIAEKPEKEEDIPERVVIALHAGGWQIANMEWGDLTPDPDDPVEIQLLDIRDGFREYAKQAEAELMKEYFKAMSRAVEIGLVTDATLHMLTEDGDMSAEEAIMKAVEADGRESLTDEMGIRDHVEGWFINAVRPETQRSTVQHDRVVEALETAREAYRRGRAFGDTFEEAYHNLS